MKVLQCSVRSLYSVVLRRTPFSDFLWRAIYRFVVRFQSIVRVTWGQILMFASFINSNAKRKQSSYCVERVGFILYWSFFIRSYNQYKFLVENPLWYTNTNTSTNDCWFLLATLFSMTIEELICHALGQRNQHSFHFICTYLLATTTFCIRHCHAKLSRKLTRTYMFTNFQTPYSNTEDGRSCWSVFTVLGSRVIWLLYM